MKCDECGMYPKDPPCPYCEALKAEKMGDQEAYDMHTCQCSACERVRASQASTAAVLREVLEEVLSEFAITDESDPVDLWVHDRIKKAIAKRLEGKA